METPQQHGLCRWIHSLFLKAFAVLYLSFMELEACLWGRNSEIQSAMGRNATKSATRPAGSCCLLHLPSAGADSSANQELFIPLGDWLFECGEAYGHDWCKVETKLRMRIRWRLMIAFHQHARSKDNGSAWVTHRFRSTEDAEFVWQLLPWHLHGHERLKLGERSAYGVSRGKHVQGRQIEELHEVQRFASFSLAESLSEPFLTKWAIHSLFIQRGGYKRCFLKVSDADMAE